MNAVAMQHMTSLQRLTDLARRLLGARTATLQLSDEGMPCCVSGAGLDTAPVETLDARLLCPETQSVLGTLGVVAAAPRAWTAEDRDMLHDLAGGLAALVSASRHAAACAVERDRLRALLDRVPGLVFERRDDGTPPAIFGAGPEAMHRLVTAGANDALAFIHAEDRERVAGALAGGTLGEGGLSVRTAGTAPRRLHCRSLAQLAPAGASVRSGIVVALAAARGGATSLSGPGPALRAAADAEGAHILLADDLDLNRKLISDMLSIEGHVVDSVADGAAAVKAAREQSYDLILMDMIMPGMDGVAATRAIRALPAPACNVPIVALTAHSLPEQLDSCIQAGMDATLTKPMTMDALTDAVATWMRRRRKAA